MAPDRSTARGRRPARRRPRGVARRASALAVAVGLLIGARSRRLPAAEEGDRAGSFLTVAEVRLLEARGWLERDPARVLRALGPYVNRVTGVEQVRLDGVRLAHLEALECVLGRVAARRLGVAQFFTDPLFRGGATPLVVLVDPATLTAMDQVFDLHTIFPPSVAPSPSSPAPVRMRFLLAGQGRLMMAYDGAARYAHPDDAYSIFGNREYEIHPFLRMTIGIHRGSPALLDLAIADGPRAPLRPFTKAVLFLRPEIHGLFVHGGDVTADTSVINRNIRPPPITWRAGPTDGARRLARNGCPADGPWNIPAAPTE